MPFKRQNRVVSQHSRAVVGDAHQTPPAEFNVNLNAFRARIKRIFNQFFNDRRGTLDDFAGGATDPQQLRRMLGLDETAR